MTSAHRRRLLIATAVTITGLGLGLGPLIAGIGLVAGLGVLALAAIPAAVVLGIVAYIWHGQDSDGPLDPHAPARFD